MLINDAERSNIVFQAIKEYKEGENDFSILISVKVMAAINKNKNQFGKIDAQDIFEEIEDTFDFFNDFIEKRKINLPKIPSEHYTLLEYKINEAMGSNKPRLEYDE